MPEHDTFDLDAAFDALERDIAGLSRGPGAARAVTTARRRRRTRIGAAAAVALVAIGGIALARDVGTHDSSVEWTTRPVPAAAALDAQSLGEATAGWAGPWSDQDMNANPERTLNPSCNINNDQTGSSSVNGGSRALQTGDGHYAQFGAIRWTGGGLATYVSTLSQALEACPGAKTTEVTYADGTRVLFVELQSLAGSPTQWGIVTRGDDELGLAIAPTTGLPDEVQVRLADAMVAGIEADSALTSVPQGGVGRVQKPEFFARFAPDRLQHVFGSWQSGWHDGPSPDSLLRDPCSSTDWVNPGMTTAVGADGRFWIHQFSSRTAAETGYQRISETLGQCPGYTVRTVSSPGGGDVLLARGDQDVWAVQHDDWVVVTYLPHAATPPPDSVSKAMGSAMVGVVDAALARFQQAQG
ncbi:MAG: hypothetical protein WAV00_21210 [Nocardioides sp.]